MKNYRERIINILERFEIPYWTEGKNVSIDSVNVQCPFCSDPSNHCGIFQDTMVFHCWRCNSKGPFERLLSKLTGFTVEECKRVIEDFDITFRESTLEQIIEILNSEEEEDERPSIKKVELPKLFEEVTERTNFPLLFKYLHRRKVNLSTVIEAGCGICRAGPYMNRLIIPVFYEGEPVAYQAADMTGMAQVKYVTGPPGVKINNFLYNYDKIDKRMIVTEGVLDAWRVGKDAVATFGTHFTEQQKQLILEKQLDELILLWDGDAYWRAREAAKFFEPFIEKVRVVKLPQNEDPDSLGEEKVQILIQEAV